MMTLGATNSTAVGIELHSANVVKKCLSIMARTSRPLKKTKDVSLVK